MKLLDVNYPADLCHPVKGLLADLRDMMRFLAYAGVADSRVKSRDVIDGMDVLPRDFQARVDYLIDWWRQALHRRLEGGSAFRHCTVVHDVQGGKYISEVHDSDNELALDAETVDFEAASFPEISPITGKPYPRDRKEAGQ